MFVEKFLSSVYIDDVSLGSNDMESTYIVYKLYLKSKSRPAEAGFKLRKFPMSFVAEWMPMSRLSRSRSRQSM